MTIYLHNPVIMKKKIIHELEWYLVVDMSNSWSRSFIADCLFCVVNLFGFNLNFQW